MPKWRCIRQCFWGDGKRNHRVWSPGEIYTGELESLHKDTADKPMYFELVTSPAKSEPEKTEKAESLKPPIEFDKPINSMKKSELIEKAIELGLEIDSDISHLALRKMIYGRLNG